MKRSVLFAFWILILTSPAFAGLSAKRHPTQSAQALINKSGALFAHQASESLDASQIVEWERFEDLEAFFRLTRDERFLKDEKEFNRRITWLYPDDGCFARAALVIQKAQELGLPLPNRVFLYGDLEAYTPNAPGFSVTWWYHTAPIVSVKGQLYVLDAAINPDKPLKIEEWTDRQIRTGLPRTLTFCSPYTYDPRTPCVNAQTDPGSKAQAEIKYFLPREWRRQTELNRDPLEVLGEHPPWL